MRIKTIAKMTKGADTLLDIGTDHGFVIIEALKSGYIKNAIATDINKGPLKRAFNNIKKESLENKVTFIQTNGFKNINLHYDCVVITGMGFQTIKNILIEPHLKPKFYVFGAQTEIENLRLFLNENNYKIIAEEIIFDKKFYIFIKAVEGQQVLSKEDLILGPFLKNNKDSLPYYKEKITNLNKITPFLNTKELIYNNNLLSIYKKALNKLE